VGDSVRMIVKGATGDADSAKKIVLEIHCLREGMILVKAGRKGRRDLRKPISLSPPERYVRSAREERKGGAQKKI